MSEPPPQPPPRETDPVEVDRELARRNMVWGWALFGLVVALFAATIVVAFVYRAVA